MLKLNDNKFLIIALAALLAKLGELNHHSVAIGYVAGLLIGLILFALITFLTQEKLPCFLLDLGHRGGISMIAALVLLNAVVYAIPVFVLTGWIGVICSGLLVLLVDEVR